MLSGPHQKFAEGVASGMNASAAYRIAYPTAKPDSVESNATRLMGNDGIAAEVQRLRDLALEKAGSAVMTLEEELRFLSRIVRCRIKNEPADSDLIQEVTRNNRYEGRGDDVESWEVEKVKLPDKLRALELFAKLTGQLNDKAVVTGDVQIRVVIGGAV
ncbi:MAG: Terminase small subunit [Verrucomicrobiales bacterium]|nr:Terminase small subunit [Verrucomicrobiales bacterium]